MDRPPRAPFHWIYYILMFLGIFAALWLHGHPYYTVTLLALVVPCSLMAYTPYRFLSRNLRFMCMIAMVLASIGWGVLRIWHREPIDKMLIESICLLAFSFYFYPRVRDYGYMLLISVLLLLYGALLPRTVYLYIIPIAFVMAMLMLYGSRINGLCGDHTLKTAVFRFSWGKIILHLFMVCLFWVYFYTIMPRQEHEGKGLFVTSFKNPNSSYIQPQVNNWFKTDKVKKGEGGIQVPGKKPDSAGKSGPKTPAKSKQGMRSSGGGGASPPGKDLVFLVKSPVKLYWLGQLYDYYDGDTWFATDRMAKQKKLRKANQGSKLIQINFTMEKWLSPILYSAYRAEACSLGYFSNHNLDSNFYQFKLPNPDKLPGLPFSYSISTEVECSEIIRRRDRKWLEFVDIKNYLELPGKKISARLAELAKSLVKDEKTAIGKATALRNYLRDNFKYEQFSQHPPEGVEAVDYFLFTLKEGHCEYFASSLAVLARLAGLPSRIGYSALPSGAPDKV